MQKHFNAKSYLNENYYECVIYFHVLHMGLRKMFVIIF